MPDLPAATSMDLAEAAALLKLHPDTLRERAASGIIPGAKIGKRWVFLADDLADWVRLQAPNAKARKPGIFGSASLLVKLYVPPARLWMRRKRSIAKAPSWAGVYFLYSGGVLTYIGSSRCVRDRIMGHATAGRVFDQFACVKAPGEAVVPLETVYIAMLRPPQNKHVGAMAPWIVEALAELAGLEDGEAC